MIIVTDTELENESFGSSVVTVGNFDGVHLGHKALISQAIKRAKEFRATAVVYTFDPHPLRLFNPAQCPPTLTDFTRKSELLEELGADVVVRARFDRDYAMRPPSWFSRHVLAEQLNAVEVWIGEDFVFGKNRTGDVHTLAEEGRELGYGVHWLGAVTIDGERISSTRVREAVANRNFALAKRLLGRPYLLNGAIVHGEARGSKLGYPTANLLAHEECLPPSGVYAGWASVRNKRYIAAINVGTNPTFDAERTTVEAHLLDFADDLYGQAMTLEFVEPIRAEIAFASPQALSKQIGLDVIEIRRIMEALKR